MDQDKSTQDTNDNKKTNDCQYTSTKDAKPIEAEVNPYKDFKPFNERGDLWKDFQPIKQFSEDVKVVKIKFDQRYEEIMDYFRGILTTNEVSQRAYDLSTEVLKHNPTNYAAWNHRRICIDNVQSISLESELDWLDSIMVENQKNYQIWNHRKIIIDLLNDCSHEKKILNEVFDDEAKNFHAWCHRIWVIRRFDCIEGEKDYIEKMLQKDIKNNSVWNYRFFLVNYIKKNDENDASFVNNEINYALGKLHNAYTNECIFSYIRGLLSKYKLSYNAFPLIKTVLLKINEHSLINHIMSMLVDIYSEEGNSVEVEKLIVELMDLDFIRKKYWGWRLSQYKTSLKPIDNTKTSSINE